MARTARSPRIGSAHRDVDLRHGYHRNTVWALERHGWAATTGPFRATQRFGRCSRRGPASESERRTIPGMSDGLLGSGRSLAGRTARHGVVSCARRHFVLSDATFSPQALGVADPHPIRLLDAGGCAMVFNRKVKYIMPHRFAQCHARRHRRSHPARHPRTARPRRRIGHRAGETVSDEPPRRLQAPQGVGTRRTRRARAGRAVAAVPPSRPPTATGRRLGRAIPPVLGWKFRPARRLSPRHDRAACAAGPRPARPNEAHATAGSCGAPRTAAVTVHGGRASQRRTA